MKTEDVLMTFVVCGVALTCFYMVTEFLSWRTKRAFDVKSGLILRDLYKKLNASGTKLHAKTIPYVARVMRRSHRA